MQASNVSAARTSPANPSGRVPEQSLVPAVDIMEGESGITLMADMPGVSKDRLSIKIEGDSLLIEGRAQINVPESIELLHSELHTPYFRRAFTLSRDLDSAKIEATLRDGVLQIHIPKSEAARPRRIEVKVV